MLLPMGEMTKPEARAYAAGRGFEKVSKRKIASGFVSVHLITVVF